MLCVTLPHLPGFVRMRSRATSYLLKPVLHQDVRVCRLCCSCSYSGRLNTHLWTNMAGRRILLPTDRHSYEVNTTALFGWLFPLLLPASEAASHKVPFTYRRIEAKTGRFAPASMEVAISSSLMLRSGQIK